MLIKPLSAKPMKFVYYDQYAPRSYKEDGVMKGSIIDIVNEVVHNRMGLEIVHKGYPWKRAQEMVKSGKADAFITVPTAERRKYTVVNKEPLFKFQTFIGTLKNHPEIETLRKARTINDLKDFKLVDYYGNGWAKSALKELEIIWMPDYDSIFRFIKQGKADIVILSKKTMHSLKKLKYADDFEVLKTPITSVSFHLCINKKSKYKYIIEEFDKHIKEMTENGEIEKIISNYY
jgi:polar amino acid transport system substrate-binding protein